jgi:hypothetical protein
VEVDADRIFEALDRVCTPRQAQALRLQIEGYSEEEIMEILGVAERHLSVTYEETRRGSQAIAGCMVGGRR